MNYLKIYNTLCERGKHDRSLNCYVEKHHIIPKCMGGTNNKDNICVLTFKEHFIVHHLLTKMYPTHKGIQYAFLCMLRKQPTGQRQLTARMFQTIKTTFAEFKREHIKVVQPGKTQKSRDTARARMLGPNNPIKKNPESNWTAKPVRLFFLDGRVLEYPCGSIAAKAHNIPYATFKLFLKERRGSTKHGIEKVIQISCEG